MEQLRSQVIAAQQGDLDAFGRLVGRFQDMAFALAYTRLGDTYLAEDAAQEAFIEAFLSLHNLLEPAAFPGWMKRIVLRQCSRALRRGRIATEPLEPALELASNEPGPDDIVERNDIDRILHLAIASLPEHERITTLLFYISSYSQQEIADFLEVPTTTVKKRLQYARNRLKENIEVMVDDYARHRPSRDTEFNRRVRMFIGVRTGNVADVRELLGQAPDLVHIRERWAETLSNLYPRAKPRTGGHPSGSADNGSGWSTLQWAVWSGDADMTALLLDNGAPVDSTDRGGMTMLNIAARHGYRQTVELLLQHGADITGAGYRCSPLHSAVGAARRATVELLLDKGADVDALDWKGRSPLHWAATCGHVEMIDLLTRRGADARRKDNAGRSPLWWASHSGHTEAAAILSASANH